ncbi:MAG: cyclic pyranopterin monophosphate synthase MoaC [Sulfolobales archaeon]|nr:cyclic pyranopterin monophosphate synthase MoaC [Sulfolobales archaeon]MCX8199283.1 cyclic pyranopterin monophosphate synthase MoaC [Sulfolobales archaeon]MDW8170403.1 cyclic pyranopterin monophosphate synthase MoaC [Desulfurococcaceae archaeon]
MGMIDVTLKEVVYREAVAEGIIKLRRDTLKRILEGRVEKGDVLTIARASAINAVKKTSELILLCHNIPITHVSVSFDVLDDERLRVRVLVKALAKTGVEMEALMGASAALLNIWDMVKSYEKDERGQYPHTSIERISVVSKVKGEAIT